MNTLARLGKGGMQNGGTRCHSNVNRKNGAGPQLNDPIGRRTKHREIQGTTATHCHNHHVGSRFEGELDDLLVGASSPYHGSDLAALGFSGGMRSSSCSIA